MILDSIAAKFRGYVFTASFPEENRSLYKLQWIHSEIPENSGDNEVYEETLTVWDIGSGKLVSSLNTNGATSSLTLLTDDIILAGVSPNYISDDPDEHDIIAVRAPTLKKMALQDLPWEQIRVYRIRKT
jgi:hypothetical protein